MTSRNDRTVAIIQARMSSSRLPRKVVLDIHGKCLLERVIGQVRRASRVDEIIVATSTVADDDIVAGIAARLTIPCFRGSLTDVRSRFVAVAEQFNATIVVRVTADNPLTEPTYIDALVDALHDNAGADYAMMAKERIPDGSGAEAYRAKALQATLTSDESDYSREHVTPALRAGAAVVLVAPSADLELGECFVGIDTFDDYLHINRLFAHYGDRADLLQQLIADVRRERAGGARAPVRARA
jgi:spore coat polysaccharide biosynthesis protein SpsF